MSLITYLTRIHFADHVLEDALPGELARLGLRRLMIVHDDAAGKGEALDRLLCALPAECEATVVKVRGAEMPEDAAAKIRAGGCDGIIGLGGRAALDLARRLPASGGGDEPVLAVPTTTACVGIAPMPPFETRKARCAKLPVAVLCDPTLTMHADAADTAAAGMDALVHCLETYLATAWNPPADGIALDGFRRASRWLVPAVEDGSDLEARRELLAAALNGALAGQKGLGAVHALAHALEDELASERVQVLESLSEAGEGRAIRAPVHGRMHAALLPPVLLFNKPAVGERFAALAQALGLGAGASLPEALAELGGQIGLPASLQEHGLAPQALERVAAKAVEEAANRTNPRHATVLDYRVLLEEAW